MSRRLPLRRILLATLATLAGLVAVLAAAVAFGTATRPPPAPPDPPMLAIRRSPDLPAPSWYRARDGAALAYRSYAGVAGRVAILLHGSACDGSCTHGVARAIHQTGATVYALDLRGHGGSGRRGDIDYVGQLDDDLADFVAAVRPRHRGAGFTLIGFSAGGALAMRIAGGSYGKLFRRFILLAPALVYPENIARPHNGNWAAVYMPRIVGLTLLDAIGIDWFDHLDAVAYAVDPGRSDFTPTYSFRLAMNFVGRGVAEGLRRAPQAMELIAGSDDQQFYADRYAPLLRPVKPDLVVEILPGIGHLSLITNPAALLAIARAFEQLPGGSHDAR